MLAAAANVSSFAANKSTTMKTGTLILFMMANTAAVLGQKPAVLMVKDTHAQADTSSYSENKNTAIAVSRAILQGDWATLDGLLDSNFTYTGDGYVFTKDQYIGFMQDMRAAFSDFEMVLEQPVVDGNFVSIRFVSHVVNTGKFMGAPANKKHLDVNGMFTRNVKNGKVMQEWQTTDLLGTMKQIGGGALFFYSVFVGGFNVKQKLPVRKPNDFLHINGLVENFDRLPAKEKNRYVKKYMKNLK